MAPGVVKQLNLTPRVPGTIARPSGQPPSQLAPQAPVGAANSYRADGQTRGQKREREQEYDIEVPDDLIF
jgi:hypothetical protein